MGQGILFVILPLTIFSFRSQTGNTDVEVNVESLFQNLKFSARSRDSDATRKVTGFARAWDSSDGCWVA